MSICRSRDRCLSLKNICQFSYSSLQANSIEVEILFNEWSTLLFHEFGLFCVYQIIIFVTSQIQKLFIVQCECIICTSLTLCLLTISIEFKFPWKNNNYNIFGFPLAVCSSRDSSVVFHARQNEYINPIGENQIIVYDALVTNEGGAYDQYNGLFKVRVSSIAKMEIKVTSTSGVNCRYSIQY